MVTKKLNCRCYASQHLHPQEWGVLEVLLRLTHGGQNTLYFDGRSIAAKFSQGSKDLVYRTVKALVREGWLLPISDTGKRRNRASGMYEAAQYKVLNHEQWIEKHGTAKCFKFEGDEVPTSLENKTGPVSESRQVQSQNQDRSSLKIADHQSQNAVPPVAPVRHSSVVKAFVRKTAVPKLPCQPEEPDAPISLKRASRSGAGTEGCVGTPSGSASPQNETGETLADRARRMDIGTLVQLYPEEAMRVYKSTNGSYTKEQLIEELVISETFKSVAVV